MSGAAAGPSLYSGLIPGSVLIPRVLGQHLTRTVSFSAPISEGCALPALQRGGGQDPERSGVLAGIPVGGAGQGMNVTYGECGAAELGHEV